MTKVQEFVLSVFVECSRDKMLTLESKIFDSSIDSLGTIEAIMMIEQEYDIEIPDPELELCRTIGDVAELTKKMIGGSND